MNTGQVCMKISGRDAGQLCVITQVLDTTYVLIDGNTRRRKCNIRHLEPLTTTVEISDNASHDEVVRALSQAGIPVVVPSKRTKERTKKGPRPVRQKAKKQSSPASKEASKKPTPAKQP